MRVLSLRLNLPTHDLSPRLNRPTRVLKLHLNRPTRVLKLHLNRLTRVLRLHPQTGSFAAIRRQLRAKAHPLIIKVQSERVPQAHRLAEQGRARPRPCRALTRARVREPQPRNQAQHVRLNAAPPRSRP